MYKLHLSILFCTFIPFFFACDSGPKVIEGESIGGETEQPIFSEENTLAKPTDQQTEHKVVVHEALNTERYTYLRVKEENEEFWVAISKRDVKIGQTYYYTGGLLKKNFQSQEFDRNFETVYLVSDFREMPMGSGNASMQAVHANAEVAAIDPGTISVEPAKGAVKISEIIANPAKYAGKMVIVTGKCVKVNPMIMGRNWVHLQDGSGKNADLTVTTVENISLGSAITLEGMIAVDKDFGAGYRYNVIMESAVVK